MARSLASDGKEGKLDRGSGRSLYKALISDLPLWDRERLCRRGRCGDATPCGGYWMKKLTIAALVAAQIAAVAPARAADLDGPFIDNRRGAFAGITLRARTGGADGGYRAGLTLAPTSHSRIGANSRMTMGEGIELGISPGTRPVVTLAGQRLDRMSLFGEPPEADRRNMSTLAKVAIVAGVVVVVGFVAFAHVMNEASCFHGGDDSDC